MCNVRVLGVSNDPSMRHDYALLSTAIYLADLMLCDKAVTLTCIRGIVHLYTFLHRHDTGYLHT